MAQHAAKSCLALTGGPEPTLQYTAPDGHIAWTMPVSALVLIAEYTTPDGPMADDYFLEFVGRAGGQPLFGTVSYYDDGVQDTLQQLSDRWGAEVITTLFASTDWDSRVLWPPELADHPYFTFSEVVPRGPLQYVRHWLLGPAIESRRTEAVRAFLASAAL